MNRLKIYQTLNMIKNIKFYLKLYNFVNLVHNNQNNPIKCPPSVKDQKTLQTKPPKLLHPSLNTKTFNPFIRYSIVSHPWSPPMETESGIKKGRHVERRIAWRKTNVVCCPFFTPRKCRGCHGHSLLCRRLCEWVSDLQEDGVSFSFSFLS